MLVSGQSKAGDLSSLLMIHSVATAFKSLLRPSDMISHDKGPAESLTAVIITDVITDVDKVLLHLDPKEFTVEPSTLQSLQQLIQWVADLALNVLARLPEQRMQIKTGGVRFFIYILLILVY
ncbi:Mediator of RNA polymerase II transcription subunit 16 [Harpegnathos saltator]|uniref:Mediator of RNA polymerase II transcription subunit 16 n=1 Tax=Harpegnathos saltator TaxID=610380 RepID=E2C7S7_HARSA|nr:Mediator of RNA polymerase II transcription subunit 16 [Harpegnathos saltator]